MRLNIMTKLTPKFGSECCCKSKARYLLYNINVYCKKMYMSESISDPICLVFLCSSSKPISLLRLYKSISVVFFSSMCNLLIHYAMHTGNLFTVSLTMKVYHGYWTDFTPTLLLTVYFLKHYDCITYWPSWIYSDS